MGRPQSTEVGSTAPILVVHAEYDELGANATKLIAVKPKIRVFIRFLS
jgi:hypothetical protein